MPQSRCAFATATLGMFSPSPILDVALSKRGDQALSIKINKLDAENQIRIQLDLDDTAGSQYVPKIEVYGDEITGATVTLDYAGQITRGTFTEDGLARVPLPDDAPDCALIS